MISKTCLYYALGKCTCPSRSRGSENETGVLNCLICSDVTQTVVSDFSACKYFKKLDSKPLARNIVKYADRITFVDSYGDKRVFRRKDMSIVYADPFKQLGHPRMFINESSAAEIFGDDWNTIPNEEQDPREAIGVFVQKESFSCPPNESLEKNVNHPSRYTSGKVECIDALDSAVVGKSPDEAICVANIIKYLWRYEQKEPVRSLMSARWYLDRLIEKAKTKYGVGE